MFKLTGAVLVTMMGAAALAQSAGVPAAEQKGFATLQEDKLRADLTFLSGGKMAGRLTAWRFGEDAKTPSFVPNPKPGRVQ